MADSALNNIARLRDILEGSRYAVFFGGAGVSTESGIPDFRGSYGIYAGTYKYPAETILSRDFFEANPEYFFEFYREKLVCPGAKPNAAHIKLAELEARGVIKAVITQNIDGLHQMAGHRNVIELHGSVYRNYCSSCMAEAAFPEVYEAPGVPRCASCGGILRPEVTLYGEELNTTAITDTVTHLSRADVLIIGGTSLAVYPAAGLLGYFRGKSVVVINKTPTPADTAADLVIHGSIGEVLGALTL